jgi:hypothetical protein
VLSDMMTKFPSSRIAASCSKKAGNGLTDLRRRKYQFRSKLFLIPKVFNSIITNKLRTKAFVVIYTEFQAS